MLALTVLSASGQTYSDISVTGTASIDLLEVAGASYFGGSMGIGPGSIDNIANYGATFWTGGPDSSSNPTGSNMAVIGSSDSSYPVGFVFKLLPDDYGDTIPTLLANWLGAGALPLDLNTDNNGAPCPGPVLVGTYDWDGQSMFQVSGPSSFSGPVELAPQGDLSMGGFMATPPPSGGGGEDDARGVGSGRFRAGSGGPILSGS